MTDLEHDDEGNLLNAQQVSRYLRISLSTVHHLTRLGKLKSIRVGKHWKYKKQDLDQYLEHGFEKVLSSYRYQGKERRRYSRVPCRIRAGLRIERTGEEAWSGEGEILNLSDSGMLMEVPDLTLYRQYQYVQSPAYFKVLPEEGVPVREELAGRIVRLESFARTRLGITFNHDWPGLPEEMGLERGLH